MERISDLFPNVSNLVIFIFYMTFCVTQGLVMSASNTKEKSYAYNTVAVVLLIELVKLIIAFLCYIKDNTLSSLWDGIKHNMKILCLYLVPSFLYCIYNNLAFINLSYFDPTSYLILLQLRIVVTGIIFQLVFNKRLTKIQWVALKFLTVGCMIQQVDWNHLKSAVYHSNQPLKNVPVFSVYIFLIIIQTLCSCFAGVYNEHLLKESGANLNIFIQNIFMYIDSIFWNFIVLVFQGNLLTVFSKENFRPILEPIVIFIILNNSIVGIITSLFLKNLNSILKTFASAIELLFTAILSWIIFEIEIKINTILAIFIVSYSLYLYSQNPVKNKVDNRKPEDNNEISLLQDV